MRLPRRLVVVIVAFVVAGLAACSGGDSIAGVAAQDRPLPRLTGETLNGDRLHVHRYADGDILVINVWASTCGPCRREQPQLAGLAERYEDRGVRFLGINYFDDRDAARAWEKEFEVPYPSLYDPAGRSAVDLGYPFLPDTYVVDRDGTIRWVVFGETDERELAGLIDDVLA
ncbi:MAG TPA: TlpA disulfide reductase family protein [Actinomycetota bacterium]|nr:TlpA disulfide reductase family protein [Actinomycetota bacterium]